MIIAQLDYHDFDGMTVAKIKEMLKDMPDDAVFDLIPANHYGDAEYLEVSHYKKDDK